ncbi:MAG: bifunctional (p)ppGpp synthetase/guanosine-3',5'-bis(diphosphate) 3'-pyrophosphohydrolase, partial [Oscillospiraceae bacterium]|nr:bifunctional (p)ppGpp synthetase/guanosine-3',5'-bis(diphosphate) 3'-pyrophosphohydrolase [Oscillospiraceae bacterium]
DIVGFITRGSGVTIHTCNCKTAVNGIVDKEQKGRWVSASWSDNIKDTYKTSVLVHGIGRSGFVADVSVTVANLHVPMHTLLARELPDHQAEVRLTIETQGVEQLRGTIEALKRIRGVDSVVRM